MMFEEFALQAGQKKHNFQNGGDTFKLGIVDDTITPTVADATPTWSDYEANEVSDAGGYTAGGITLANQSFAEADGVGTFDADDATLAQNGSGFENAWWGIIYNASDPGLAAIAFVEMAGPVSEQAGPVAFRWGAAGILRFTANPT